MDTPTPEQFADSMIKNYGIVTSIKKMDRALEFVNNLGNHAPEAKEFIVSARNYMLTKNEC